MLRGIIPARAGFTSAQYGSGRSTGDHPRSRGVYPGWSTPYSNQYGSSPLARGLLKPLATILLKRGIIPARAGFTASLHVSRSTKRDHPRSRGVYNCEPTPDVSPLGSSPLARGLHKGSETRVCNFGIIPARAGFTGGVFIIDMLNDRIIPARAGFTGSHPYLECVFEDHPRSRGVYWPMPTVIGSL